MVLKRIIPLLLLLLLFCGALNLVSQAAYRAGWTEGYVTRQQLERPGEMGPPVGPYRAPGWSWGGSPFFWFVGGLLKFGLFLLLGGLLFKLLFFGRGRRRGWRCYKAKSGEEIAAPYEKKPEDVEPRLDTT